MRKRPRRSRRRGILPVKIAHTLDEAIQFGGPVFDFDQVDQKPLPIDQVHPNYPVKDRDASTDGKAVVRFVVTTDGGVVGAEVTEASAPEFGDAALDAVRQWIFQPGKIDGRPVNTWMSTPLTFRVRE